MHAFARVACGSVIPETGVCVPVLQNFCGVLCLVYRPELMFGWVSPTEQIGSDSVNSKVWTPLSAGVESPSPGPCQWFFRKLVI